MPEQIPIDYSVLQTWYHAKMSIDKIKEQLHLKGLDESSISLYLSEYKKLRNKEKQMVGFVYMAIGAVLGFVSCVLSIINPIPELFEVILYGFTSVSIILIGIGMYFVFE